MTNVLVVLWFLFWGLLSLAWICFVVWAIYTVVTTYAHSH